LNEGGPGFSAHLFIILLTVASFTWYPPFLLINLLITQFTYP